MLHWSSWQWDPVGQPSSRHSCLPAPTHSNKASGARSARRGRGPQVPRGPRACRVDATGCRSVVTDFQPTQEEPCLHFVPSCGEGVPRLGANVCPELPSGRGSWPWSQDAKLDCLKDTSRPGGVCQPWHPGVGCLGTRQELAAGVQERAGWRLAPAVQGRATISRWQARRAV